MPTSTPNPPFGTGVAWWPDIHSRALQAPASPRLALLLGAQEVGSVAPPLAALVQQAGLPLVAGVDGASVMLDGDPDQALRRIAAWLRENGHAGRWRDELLAVRAMAGGPSLAVVERGVARNLGIHTCAVQLHARDPVSGRWWLQQRALDKATDPGKWDTLMGGLVSAGESVEAALQRESWEEAGVRLGGLAAAPVDAGCFTVRRPVFDAGSHGYMVETVVAFACTLQAGQRPSNQDGEVMRFATFSDDEIDGLVFDGELALEAAVAVALCRSSLRA